ncbi:6-carboxytetrahydropterin synthase QueD [Candidatus Pacearchaeota archaeon]|nr:6-carboxytetrahydropterin synthase QueD [Candidatus Pacearchaeota archaeon]|tara:strand:- start:1081 stop:1455 length:375 start_codon:yes stop_codon:yes gene_type:complete
MIVDISKDFHFEAAHRLPNISPDNKCYRLHGHSYLITITLEGLVDKHTGIFFDYNDISKVVDPVIDRLDHYYLNEIEGLENPTAENLAYWLWININAELPGLKRVNIRETCTASCGYEGDPENW